jgi:hypothetical protein
MSKKHLQERSKGSGPWPLPKKKKLRKLQKDQSLSTIGLQSALFR